MGMGMGLSFAPVSVAVLERVPAAKAGMASAVTNTMREIGGVVGIAALGAILTSRMTGLLGERLNRPGVGAAQVHQVTSAVTNGGAGGIAANRTLPPPLRGIVDSSFVDSLHLALRAGAGLLALGAVAAVVMLRAAAPSRPGPAGTGGSGGSDPGAADAADPAEVAKGAEIAVGDFSTAATAHE